MQVQDNVDVQKEGRKSGNPALIDAPIVLLQRNIITQTDWAVLPDEMKSQILLSHGINPDQYIAQYEAMQTRKSVEAQFEQSATVTQVPVAQIPVAQPQVPRQDLGTAPIVENRLPNNPVTKTPEVAVNPNFPQNPRPEKVISLDDTPQRSTQETPNMQAIDNQSEVRKQFEDLKNEVKKAEQQVAISKESLVRENNAPGGKELSVEDKQRIAVERAMSQNAGVPKLFGYQPSAQTSANASSIATSNPVSDGRTWVASILKKILLSFK